MAEHHFGSGSVTENPRNESRRRSALRLQFVLTSLPVGGAEILLKDLITHMHPDDFQPEVVCMKEAGELGETISSYVPLRTNVLRHKWDFGVVGRLAKHFKERQADAVITVGAGDKMFWGRVAAWRAGVPVICSAIHSTGWPDGIGYLNRCLTPITSGFIACASNHAKHLIELERFPEKKVFTVPNGVDTNRFCPNYERRAALRSELGVDSNARLVGIVAALREEKNHLQFVQAARRVANELPQTHFVIVGDGPERSRIEAEINELQLGPQFHMLGSRSDTEVILAGLDVFSLTSKNEASPVSILEALACGVPVVAPDVGSISESVIHRRTGFLTEPESVNSTAEAIIKLLKNGPVASSIGLAGRKLVCESRSVESMVEGYQSMISGLYNEKARRRRIPEWEASTQPVKKQLCDARLSNNSGYGQSAKEADSDKASSGKTSTGAAPTDKQVAIPLSAYANGGYQRGSTADSTAELQVDDTRAETSFVPTEQRAEARIIAFPGLAGSDSSPVNQQS